MSKETIMLSNSNYWYNPGVSFDIYRNIANGSEKQLLNMKLKKV